MAKTQRTPSPIDHGIRPAKKPDVDAINTFEMLISGAVPPRQATFVTWQVLPCSRLHRSNLENSGTISDTMTTL